LYGVGLLLFLALLALDGYFAATAARQNLQKARDALRAGADALAQGTPTDAAGQFLIAADASGDADEAMHRISIRLGRLLPMVRDDIDAVRTLAGALKTTTRAASTLTDAAVDAGWGTGGTQGLDTALLVQIAPALESAANDLRTATEQVMGIRTDGLFGQVRDAVLDARGELEGRADLIAKATDLSQLLPSFLQDGRRYLLVIQNPDEPRGTGGFMGSFGMLTVRDGQLELEEMIQTGDLPESAFQLEPVEASKEFEARWERFAALTDPRQANFTPDLPTAAGVILQMADQIGFGEFDGVIMVDQIWISYMLEATGPIETPAWDEPITADNAVQVLSHDVFLSEDEDEIQKEIATSFWEAMEARSLSPDALATALSRGAAERHLQIYSVHPEDQELLVRLAADGSATLGRNPVYVVWSALSANKAAWFQDRRIEVEALLLEDGTAQVTTTLRLRNNAETSPEGNLFGSGEDFPVGTWASHVSVYMPEEIEGYPLFDYSGESVTGMEEEFGRPVALGFVWAPAAEQMTWSVTYVAPDAWDQGPDGGGRYQLDFLPQPALSPLPVKIVVRTPEGFVPVEGSPGMVFEADATVWSDRPATAQSVWVRFA
jgi:hypothetical protein